VEKVRNCNGIMIDVDVNFNDCDLLSEFVDTSLLCMFHTFVFYGIDRYTNPIISCIRKEMKDSDIYIIQQNKQDDFLEQNIICISDIEEIENLLPYKFMYIYSGLETTFRHKYAYSSLSVISSLCWARIVSHPGERNKTVLLINMEFGKGCGLAYIIRTVNVLKTMAYERGWDAVVKLGGQNMYLDDPEGNMWENYFEVDKNADEELLQSSKNVIDLKENHFSPSAIYYNPYFKEIWEDVDRHVITDLRKELVEEFNDKLFHELTESEEKVLGAFIRGTDGSFEASEPYAIEHMVKQCKKLMKKENIKKIFLATEDEKIFAGFQAAFEDDLLYIEQKRVAKSEQDNILIGDMLNTPVGEKEKFGRDYLYIIYCLSKCNRLAFNIKSGGYYLAHIWKDSEYDEEVQLRYTESETEKIDDITEYLQEGKKICIYGVGNIGSKLMDYFKKYNAFIGFS
jgi:hypothetical protein